MTIKAFLSRKLQHTLSNKAVRKWAGLLYFGALSLVLPPAYLLYDLRHDGRDRTAEVAVPIEARLELVAIKHKSTLSFQPLLIAEGKELRPSCGAPAYVDCYPGIKEHNKLDVVAHIKDPTGPVPLLSKIEIKATGQVAVGSEFFEKRRLRLIEGTYRIIKIFAALGIALILFALVKIKLEKN